jgi:ribosomal protein S18 acetylase RimI-like enzyme
MAYLGHMADPPHPIVSCPPALRTAALKRLGRDLSADSQQSLAVAVTQALEIGRRSPEQDPWEGLFCVLDEAGEPLNCVWVQLQPGRTALLWPPTGEAVGSASLTKWAIGWSRSRHCAVVQVAVPSEESISLKDLRLAGITPLAELLYLYYDLHLATPSQSVGNFPKGGAGLREVGIGEQRTAGNLASLVFEGHAGEDISRLTHVIRRTYVDTCDCPALDGVRRVEDVLEGYRAQGVWLPAHWYVVSEAGKDVGVLLLAAYPDTGNWELMYMGVVPEARGRGLGAKLLARALSDASAVDAERLVLAVDRENSPALAAYRAAGFREWDSRTVLAWLERDSGDGQ